jgi:hypothetical protein
MAGAVASAAIGGLPGLRVLSRSRSSTRSRRSAVASATRSAGAVLGVDLEEHHCRRVAAVGRGARHPAPGFSVSGQCVVDFFLDADTAGFALEAITPASANTRDAGSGLQFGCSCGAP